MPINIEVINYCDGNVAELAALGNVVVTTATEWLFLRHPLVHQSERVMEAEVPVTSNGDRCPKREFAIDLEKMEVRCPAGQTTNDYRPAGEGRGGRLVFAAAICEACPLRSQCVRGKGSRTLTIQAEEGLQQRARVHNQTAAGRQSLRQRVVVEHRIARLVQLGIRQSRYLGRTKTCLQVG